MHPFRFLILASAILSSTDLSAQSTPPDSRHLQSLLSAAPPIVQHVLRHTDSFRVQILYTQIDRDANGTPRLTHHGYRLNASEYHYPASTVKLPVAALALQRLGELARPGLSAETTMITEADKSWQSAVYNDPTAADGRATVAQYIRKILLVSDNDAYNRLYEWLGPTYINEELRKRGLTNTLIRHRLSTPLSDIQQLQTPPVRFVQGNVTLFYNAATTHASYSTSPLPLGLGFIRNGERVNEPFDFGAKNRFALADLHGTVQRIMLPETIPVQQRFGLSPASLAFLWRYMGMHPAESAAPDYKETEDGYGKFLIYGGGGAAMDTSLRIFNKCGDAYGFLTDAAYIVHFEKGAEFLLSATIYCNGDGIFNDDQYDYERIGFPFLKALGQTILDAEIKRPKSVKPDLSRYKF